MLISILFCLSFLLLRQFSNAQERLKQNDMGVFGEHAIHRLDSIEIPKLDHQDHVIYHTAYTLSYNEKHEQASWVAYELTQNETKIIYSRTNKFIPDPYVATKTANDNDYLGSGYDRGHLAPASDMGWSLTTMTESFYYSNMSPQVPSFNRGIWKKLEEQVRTWAIEYDTVYVVTGPVLKDGLPTIGKNKVSIPEYYYKVVLEYSKSDVKGIGFVMKNESSVDPLQNFAVPIDSVEKLTGIDFFPKLSDDQERTIEKTVCKDCWTWKIQKIKSKKVDQSDVSESEKSKSKNLFLQHSLQCTANTKSGSRCKRTTKSANQKCFQHGGY